MIVTRLHGGLGNQLFQYAAGRALAATNGVSLALDIRPLQVITKGTKRPYLLDKFAINATIATPAELPSRFPFPKKHALAPFTEASLEFDPSVLALPNNTYLEGYWQSEQYFASIAKEIRAELTLVAQPDAANAALLDEITSCEAVSLHIRRGDYVSNPKAAEYHGLCSLDYYEEAVKTIAEKIKSPRFFIFSDDPEWTKANITMPFPHQYVSNNQEEPWEDMRLLRTCKHAIIANSTFSWWGAWLIENKNKTVIAPKQWFSNANASSETLVPKSWIRL